MDDLHKLQHLDQPQLLDLRTAQLFLIYVLPKQLLNLNRVPVFELQPELLQQHLDQEHWLVHLVPKLLDWLSTLKQLQRVVFAHQKEWQEIYFLIQLNLVNLELLQLFFAWCFEKFQAVPCHKQVRLQPSQLQKMLEDLVSQLQLDLQNL